ncbi:hypothetical protein ULG90_14735 [Halopseudomonas pachastrellae]|nr:hypothetical protein ULG90_14735 [Halopseudomonas pachastrellae]
MLNVNQTHLHHTLSILLANGLMTLGLGLVWLGIRAFFERTQPQLVPLLATLLIIVLLGVFRYQFDSNAVRYAISSVILGGLCLLCASELLRPTEPPLRSACWFSGAIALLYGLMLLAPGRLTARLERRRQSARRPAAVDHPARRHGSPDRHGHRFYPDDPLPQSGRAAPPVRARRADRHPEPPQPAPAGRRPARAHAA